MYGSQDKQDLEGALTKCLTIFIITQLTKHFEETPMSEIQCLKGQHLLLVEPYSHVVCV